MGKKTNFLLYIDHLQATLPLLTMEERGELLTALMEHAASPEADVSISSDKVQMAFNIMRNAMDASFEKYNEISEKRRAAARSRYANASKSMQVQNLHYDTDTDTVTDTDTDTDTDRDKSLWAALPPLSPGDEALLRRSSGDERADALIGDVRNYYTAHPEKRFPGWPIALAQFDANQKRWGTANKPRQKTDAEIIAEMEKEGMFE